MSWAAAVAVAVVAGLLTVRAVEWAATQDKADKADKAEASHRMVLLAEEAVLILCLWNVARVVAVVVAQPAQVARGVGFQGVLPVPEEPLRWAPHLQ